MLEKINAIIPEGYYAEYAVFDFGEKDILVNKQTTDTLTTTSEPFILTSILGIAVNGNSEEKPFTINLEDSSNANSFFRNMMNSKLVCVKAETKSLLPAYRRIEPNATITLTIGNPSNTENITCQVALEGFKIKRKA